jgi:hypothetical protein
MRSCRSAREEPFEAPASDKGDLDIFLERGKYVQIGLVD